MTLDEAITLLKFNNKHIEYLKNDDLQQIAEWLEDYECIKQWKSDIMDSFYKYDVSSFEELVTNAKTKAIDDFAKLVETWCWKHEQYNQDDLNTLMDIAEQLKAGENCEQR